MPISSESDWTCMNYDGQCDLQEKSFECHRKCPRVRRHAMGAGSVSSAILDHLLLLCLERSEVHGEGRTRTLGFCVLYVKYSTTLKLLKNKAIME